MREPIRVLHLVNQLTVGGSERQMYVLIRGLDKSRVESSVGFLRTGSGELLQPLQGLGTDPQEYSLRGSIAQWNTITQIRRIADRCRRDRIALIHAHDLWANAIAVAAAKLARIPVIISRRDMADFRPAKERRILRFVSRFASAIVANGTKIRDLAVREGASPHLIHVIPNGIDVAAFDRDQSMPVSEPLPARIAGVRRIAVIGNMDRPHKGHSDVLVAAARLRHQPLDWLFLSDGPLRPQLEQQAAQLGISHLVHFVGRRRDVASVLGNVDMLVHGSLSEGFPNVVMEALCARLPVVATDVGGTADLIRNGDTGLLTSPGRPEELASALCCLLNDWESAERFGRAGRQLIEDRFTVEKATARFEQVYVDLARPGTRTIEKQIQRRAA